MNNGQEDGREVDILKLEEEIDEAIQNEDYEKLNLLLDKRQEVLSLLSEEILREIYERDKKRQEVLSQKLAEFKNITVQIEEGKKMVRSYIQQDDKGQMLNSEG